LGAGEVGGDLGELVERGLEILDDLGGEEGGVAKVGGVAEAVVLELARSSTSNRPA
jgi:hypothetical protein